VFCVSKHIPNVYLSGCIISSIAMFVYWRVLAAPVPKCSFDQNPGFVHGLEADSLRIFPSISGCLTSDASKPLKTHIQ